MGHRAGEGPVAVRSRCVAGSGTFALARYTSLGTLIGARGPGKLHLTASRADATIILAAAGDRLPR